MKHKVYVLYGIDLKIRYIGITSGSLQDRLKQHIKESFNIHHYGTHKKNWIQKLLRSGDTPQIRCVFSSNSYDEVFSLESNLIVKYKKKKNLVNDISGPVEGRKRRKVYIYSYDGSFLQECKSIKEAGKVTKVSMSTIDRCLIKEYKYAKDFQFSPKKEKMPDLTNYGKGSSIPIKLIDNQTGDNLFFSSAKLCRERMELDFIGTSAKHIRGSINKKYGDRYKVIIDGVEKTSTYYNKGVLVNDSNGNHFFESQKDLKKVMGIMSGTTRKQMIKYINKYFNDVSKIQFNCSLVK